MLSGKGHDREYKFFMRPPVKLRKNKKFSFEVIVVIPALHLTAIFSKCLKNKPPHFSKHQLNFSSRTRRNDAHLTNIKRICLLTEMALDIRIFSTGDKNFTSFNGSTKNNITFKTSNSVQIVPLTLQCVFPLFETSFLNGSSVKNNKRKQ